MELLIRRLGLMAALTMLVVLRPIPLFALVRAGSEVVPFGSEESGRIERRSTPPNVSHQVWEATDSGGEVEFLVVLAERADLAPAGSLPTREARLRYAYDALRSVAMRSQASLRAELNAAGVPYRAYYIVNMLAVKGDRALVARLAARAGVARIAANPQVRQPLPEPQPQFDSVCSLAPQEVEWNVARINADDVWALGYAGRGIVVAGQDTGYDWDHPALVNQYRGYDGVTVTHDYSWHDAIHEDDPHTLSGNPCGFDSPVPCDDDGHGTHTMGIIVGDDGAGNQVGVAPGARWIGCRNMEQEWGTPAAYIECFEFFLAPYPVGADPMTDGVPSLAPHVINNSWTCPSSEGCDWDTLQEVVENVRAAGIVVVASAGNSGPSCGTVEDPIAIYDAALSVGATNALDQIASFSSRGPVTVDGSGRLKPDVAAPGVSIRSSRRGGGYTDMSGTSMAGPHVAGMVALLWSAAPALVGDMDATEWLVTRTARPMTTTTTMVCGDDDADDVPNNVYGWGIVDALAAIPRLEVTKRAFPDVVLPGERLAYTLYVTNTGGLTLTAAITDYLPHHIASGETADGTAIVPGGALAWSPVTVRPGSVWTETLAITVQMGYAGPLTNVVHVVTGEGARGAYTCSLPSGLYVAKAVAASQVTPGSLLVYTLGFTNTAGFTLTQVVLTDTIPEGTTFAWADGSRTSVGGTLGELGPTVITWTAPSLASQDVLTGTLAVTVSNLAPGTRLVNSTYGARAAELFSLVTGAPVEVRIPWRCALPLILRDWSPGERGFQGRNG
jgi:serine protease AprX